MLLITRLAKLVFFIHLQVLLNVRNPTKWYDSVKDAIYRYVYVLKIGWISEFF
jgi:hypothetical protein